MAHIHSENRSRKEYPGVDCIYLCRITHAHTGQKGGVTEIKGHLVARIDTGEFLRVRVVRPHLGEYPLRDDISHDLTPNGGLQLALAPMERRGRPKKAAPRAGKKPVSMPIQAAEEVVEDALEEAKRNVVRSQALARGQFAKNTGHVQKEPPPIPAPPTPERHESEALPLEEDPLTDSGGDPETVGREI